MWQPSETTKVEITNTVTDIQEDLSHEYNKIIYKAKKEQVGMDFYLYIQIAFMLILIVTSFILKGGNQATFEYAKSSYQEMFETERGLENSFSYKVFMDKMQNEIEIRYSQLMETISSVTGKGSAGLYPDNVSLAKYNLNERGIMPLTGYISSSFGVRTDPFNSKKKDFHTGLDIAAAKGSFIKSAFSGVVIKAEYSPTAGNYITMQHGDSLTTLYAHNQFLLVKEGDYVMQGQVVATVGETGNATGPHLHFEIILDGVKHNPIYAIDI